MKQTQMEQNILDIQHYYNDLPVLESLNTVIRFFYNGEPLRVVIEAGNIKVDGELLMIETAAQGSELLNRGFICVLKHISTDTYFIGYNNAGITANLSISERLSEYGVQILGATQKGNIKRYYLEQDNKSFPIANFAVIGIITGFANIIGI